MGVYIEGMEMPVTCCHCPLIGYDPDIEWVDGGRETQGAYICVITHKLIDNTKREDHCPLVSVPDPHGRLGDLDAVVEKLKRLREYHSDDSQSGVFIAHGITQCIEVLTGKEAPTIIPAEEGE